MPPILRWFQVRISFYLHRLVVEQDPTVPVPHIDERVAPGVPPAAPSAPPTAPRGAPTGRGSGAQPPRGGAAGQDAEPRAPEAQNPRPVASWLAALDASPLRIGALREHAPTVVRDGQRMQLCLSFHLRGTCYENCSRAATHRPLSVTERASISQMIAQRLTQPAGGSAGGTGAGAPAPAAGSANGTDA